MKHLQIATVAPSAAPTKIGQHYVDTVAKKEYFSVGTGDVSDWVERGSGGGGGGGQSLYPVWRAPAQFYLWGGANCYKDGVDEAPSAGILTGNTWVIPFFIAQDASLTGIAMFLNGTIPAGNFEFSLQPFPSNPAVADVAITYKQAIAYTSLVDGIPVNLTTAQTLAAGVHFLYMRASANAPAMTGPNMYQITDAGDPVLDTPLSCAMRFGNFGGQVGLISSYSAASLNVGQMPNPYTDGMASDTGDVPAVRLVFDHIAP